MIGKDVYIHPTAEINSNADIGDGTQIWNLAQVREKSKIGNHCRIGKNVYIDYDVEIGDRVKIQNNVSVYHGVRIGDDVFLGPHCCFTNDLYPRAPIGMFEIGKTFIEDGVSIGANATIICGHKIGKYAMIGAGSVVTKDIPPYALAYGNPAKIRGYVCEMGHKLEKKEGKYYCRECNKIVDVGNVSEKSICQIMT